RDSPPTPRRALPQSPSSGGPADIAQTQVRGWIRSRRRVESDARSSALAAATSAGGGSDALHNAADTFVDLDPRLPAEQVARALVHEDADDQAIRTLRHLARAVHIEVAQAHRLDAVDVRKVARVYLAHQLLAGVWIQRPRRHVLGQGQRRLIPIDRRRRRI